MESTDYIPFFSAVIGGLLVALLPFFVALGIARLGTLPRRVTFSALCTLLTYGRNGRSICCAGAFASGIHSPGANLVFARTPYARQCCRLLCGVPRLRDGVRATGAHGRLASLAPEALGGCACRAGR